MASTTYVDQKIAEAQISGTSTPVDLSNYYTKSEVNGLLPTSTTQLSNDSGYITSAALEGLASETAVNGVASRVSTLESYIPAQASASNQLADKDFVNSSIATNTATFRGTVTSVAGLSQIINADKNDYAFVIDKDADGNTVYNRYKYDGAVWTFEYALNNSSFTAAQWEAINSGITAGKISQYDGYAASITGVAAAIPTKVSDLTNDSNFIDGAGARTESIYIVDYNNPNFAEAVAAFNAGKLVVLKGAAPDANSYAFINYVSPSKITFSKFLTSRSNSYAVLNTYYLLSDNTWDDGDQSNGDPVGGGSNARFNAVVANVSTTSTDADLTSLKVGKITYKIPSPDLTGYAQSTEVAAVADRVTAIEGFIPVAATTANQLADKAYVNTQIANAQMSGTGTPVDLSNYYTKGEVDGLIPTSTTQLANDSGYITSAALSGYVSTTQLASDLAVYVPSTSLAAVATSGSYEDLTNKPTIPSIEGLASQTALDAVVSSVSTINSYIPNTVSTTNILADKDFVNSSIATNTASFKGTVTSVAALDSITGADNNDYAFVIATDSDGNTVYNRYKYDGSAWAFEYALNNSSFTAAQWATINSGLAASDKTKYDGYEPSISANAANISSVSAAVDALATVASTGSYNDLIDKPSSSDVEFESDSESSSITTRDLGGIPAGTDLSGMSLSEIIEQLLITAGASINSIVYYGSLSNFDPDEDTPTESQIKSLSSTTNTSATFDVSITTQNNCACIACSQDIVSIMYNNMEYINALAPYTVAVDGTNYEVFVGDVTSGTRTYALTIEEKE